MNFLKIVLIVVAVALLGVCIWQFVLFMRDIVRAKKKKQLEVNKSQGKENE